MANTAKPVVNSDILAKLDAVIKMNEALLAENESLRQKISTNKDGRRNVELGCNACMGVTLTSAAGDIEIDVKFGDIVTISSEDMNVLLKSNANRQLLINNIIYFVDPSEYENFGVRARVDMSDDKLIDIICNGSEKQLQTYLEDSTSKKFQSDVVNTLFYKIVIMNMNGAFGNMKYENRKVIENYFNMEIDMATRLYKSMISVIG